MVRSRAFETAMRFTSLSVASEQFGTDPTKPRDHYRFSGVENHHAEKNAKEN